jgi:polar amino acid transport system substrate-binding protein
MMCMFANAFEKITCLINRLLNETGRPDGQIYCFCTLAAMAAALTRQNHTFRDELQIPTQLIAATEGDFPPFSIGTSSEDVRGIEMTIFMEICRRIDVEYKPRFVKWVDILDGLCTGTREFDCSSASMDITPDRNSKFFMTRPYVTTQCRIVCLASKPVSISRQQIEQRDSSALKDYRIATIENSTFENHLRAFGATVVTTSAVGRLWLHMIQTGEIDAFATEGRHAESMVREAHETMQLQLAATEHPLHTMSKGFAVPHSRPLLFDAIESALAARRAEGALEELVRHGVEQASMSAVEQASMSASSSNREHVEHEHAPLALP